MSRSQNILKSNMKKNSDCLKYCIAIMKYTGVWMPDGLNDSEKFRYLAYALTVQIVFFVLVLAAEIGYWYRVSSDTEQSVDSAVLLLSHLVQGVKVLTIGCRQARIKRLINYIDGPEFKNTDPAKQAILAKNVRLITIASQTILAMTAVTAMFWWIVPMLKSELTLPLKTAYPFDFNGPHMFTLMYAYTAVSVSIVGVGDAAENYLVAGLIMLAGGQLDVLCVELGEIGKGKRPSYDKTVRCIKYHQNIIKYVDELSSIFGLPIFCQCVVSSVVVCMTLFKITMTTEPIELMSIIFYLICVFLELLMYCYPGDLLINKSLQVKEAACPNFANEDNRSRQALLLTIVRAQRALRINAGGLFTVSLPTAAGVVQTAYSYYAVLRQKANDESH